MSQLSLPPLLLYGFFSMTCPGEEQFVCNVNPAKMLAGSSVKRAFENLMHWKPLGMQLFKVME